MKQKDVFLQSEGDAWFNRNIFALNNRQLPDADPLLTMLIETPLWSMVNGQQNINDTKPRVLEIGCGDGSRLAWLQDHLDVECYGIEPSSMGVSNANSKGVHALQGTADTLPFDDQHFDLILFGFCLYLCDREDLFLIASEANRVLRNPGWLGILDFYNPIAQSRSYHHKEGINSYKMDYRQLFMWHPSYECMNHKVLHHESLGYTDQADQWIGVSLLRKLT